MSIDLTGHNIAQAAARLDFEISEELERNEIMLLDRGATQDEAAAFIKSREGELALWKRQVLAELERTLSVWLSPGRHTHAHAPLQ